MMTTAATTVVSRRPGVGVRAMAGKSGGFGSSAKKKGKSAGGGFGAGGKVEGSKKGWDTYGVSIRPGDGKEWLGLGEIRVEKGTDAGEALSTQVKQLNAGAKKMYPHFFSRALGGNADTVRYAVVSGGWVQADPVESDRFLQVDVSSTSSDEPRGQLKFAYAPADSSSRNRFDLSTGGGKGSAGGGASMRANTKGRLEGV